MKLADMAEYIRVVYGLLDDGIVEMEVKGKRRKIKFLNPEIGLLNIKDPVKLRVSAYGPKSQALVAKLNAAWMTFVSEVDGAIEALRSMQASWSEAGNAPSDL